MATLIARSVLAGAVGVAVLYEAAMCGPAHAVVQPLAFVGTASLHPVLELFDSSGTLVATVSTSSALGVFQGFISNSDPTVLPSLGGPTGTNTSYAAGSYNGMLLVDYLGFNLASLPSTVTSITSATLVMDSGQVSTGGVTYTLFGATQWVTELETPGDQNAALYANLVNGVSTDFYDSVQIGASMTPVTLLLNAAAVSDINTAIESKGVFAVGGQVSGVAVVPEPSTWVMLLAGFAGLGAVARRRAAKRRAEVG